MKTAPAFDARAYARRLKQAGVAAKADLDAGIGRLDARIDNLKVEGDARFDRLETRVAPAIFGAVGAPFAALKLFGGA